MRYEVAIVHGESKTLFNVLRVKSEEDWEVLESFEWREDADNFIIERLIYPTSEDNYKD